MATASVPVTEDVVDSETYYEHARPEVANVVPRDVRQIVDVGCGAGALGRSLRRARPGVQVRGVEIVPDQAARARRVLDDCHVGAAEDPLPSSWPRPDCVIFADVLEHLVDPWQVLRNWRRWLAPGGALVVSIPNVRHHSVIAGLLRGRWDYADEGILDRTHLRFFTRGTALEMVESAGFTIERTERTIDEELRGLSRRFGPRDGRTDFGHSARELFWDLFTFQHLIVAR